MVQYAVDRGRESLMASMEFMLQLFQLMELSVFLQIAVNWPDFSSSLVYQYFACF